MGEPSKMLFCRQGNTMPATAVPKKVMAMTSVASSTMVCMLTMLNAYMIEMITEGMAISSKALTGVLVRVSIFDTHSGNIRSRAAAKITRVEDRNTVPDQPNHQKLTRSTTMNWSKRLVVRNVANCTGEGQT